MLGPQLTNHACTPIHSNHYCYKTMKKQEHNCLFLTDNKQNKGKSIECRKTSRKSVGHQIHEDC